MDLLIITMVLSSLVLVCADPCTYHFEIDEWKRSVAYGAGERCDSMLSEGWYRITSKAGEQMPTSCIPLGGKCETSNTLWLNGTYPSVGETANVTVCASDTISSNCCIKSYDIQIKNCDAYYVYHLVPVEGCPQSYCFGSELPCPVGETSKNGFSPGCKDAVMRCPDGQTSSTGYSPGCKVDPCFAGNYKELNEYKRSVGYTADDNKCDNFLEPGWYRPVSKAGYTMPTECPRQSSSCGTAFPIWMNGTHPQRDQTLTAKACTSVFSEGNCCKKSYDIEVKNCGSFYVYYLDKTSYCNSGYCFGSEVPCKEHEASDNGFTPGCKAVPRPTTASGTKPSQLTPISIVKGKYTIPLIGIGISVIVLLVIIIMTMIWCRRSKQECAVNCAIADENPPTYREAMKGCQKTTVPSSKTFKECQQVWYTLRVQQKDEIFA